MLEYIDTDSAARTTREQIVRARVCATCFFTDEQMCVAFPSDASLGARVCMWWMIRRMQAGVSNIWSAYCAVPKGGKAKVLPVPSESVFLPTNTIFATFFFFPPPRTSGGIPGPNYLLFWPCIWSTKCPLSQTIIITLWRSRPFLSLSSLLSRRWAEVTAVTVPLPRPRVLCRFVLAPQGCPTWLFQQQWLIASALNEVALRLTVPTEKGNSSAVR